MREAPRDETWTWLPSGNAGVSGAITGILAFGQAAIQRGKKR